MTQRQRGSKDDYQAGNESSHLLQKKYVRLHHNKNEAQPTTSNEANNTRYEADFQRHSIQNDSEDVESSNVVNGHNQKQIDYCNCRISQKRLPKGKGVLLVFAIYFLESFSFYSTLSGLQHVLFGEEISAIWIFTFLDGTAGRVVYPVAGVIADTYLGRYQVIHIGLWLLWIGFAILALCQSLVSLYSKSIMIGYILPILSAVVISIGAGSVEVNTVSFGVDQLAQGVPSEELSSYFYWYYVMRNAGYLAAVLSSFILQASFEVDVSDKVSPEDYTQSSTQSVLAVASVTLALLLHYCLQNWYFKDRNRENPLRSILNVLYFSATVKRGLPVYRRAFRHGEKKKSRIELAKIDYDGIFPSAEVEDVKTFCRILFLLITLAGYFFTFGAVYSMLEYEIDEASSNLGIYNYLTTKILTLVNVTTYIVVLPILNHILIPFFPRCNMRMRIGCGLACIILSYVIAIFLRARAPDFSLTARLWWLVLPAIVISIGDALTIVTGVEFIYAQSPESMKGLLTGLLYLEYGVFNGIAAIFFNYYPFLVTPFDSILYYYVTMTLLALLGFIGYVIVAWLYRNRQRPTNDDSEGDLVRRRFAQIRFSS